MSILNEPIHTLRGDETSLSEFGGKAILAVNVASKCGLTPQYTGLEALQEKYSDRGFTVVGFPCNQFGAQEPGSAEEIETFCSITYGVTFPMMEKIDVNGDNRHPIYVGPDRDSRRRGPLGGHPLELREVPHRSRRSGHAILSRGDAGGSGARGRNRGEPSRLTPVASRSQGFVRGG